MTISTCTGDHYTCGETSSWPIASTHAGSLSHTRNRNMTFMLGETEIVVNRVSRNFQLSYSGGWRSSAEFLMRDSSGNLFDCGGDRDNTNSHSVSEQYECITTVLGFLDMRYKNAIGVETIESISFSEASGEMAGFKETWGIFYYPKYVITNHVLTKAVKYFIVLNGARTVLKTDVFTTPVNDTTNPLILVYPQPGGLAIPWINCDDIKEFGFYDYHAIGEGEGQEKIQRDGGDDFYFTDWMRNIGVASQNLDQKDADDRYFEFYLGDGASSPTTYANPGIFIDERPIGSIAVDPDGNIMYSAELGGEVFNFLTEGDLTSFDERIPAGSKLFPVGLI